MDGTLFLADMQGNASGPFFTFRAAGAAAYCGYQSLDSKPARNPALASTLLAPLVACHRPLGRHQCVHDHQELLRGACLGEGKGRRAAAEARGGEGGTVAAG